MRRRVAELRHFRVIAESRTPIQPISVVRAARPCHLHVTLIVCFAVPTQSRAIWGLKLPALVHTPIFVNDPAFTFVRMTPFCPGIEHRKEHCPELAKSDVADDGIPRWVRSYRLSFFAGAMRNRLRE